MENIHKGHRERVRTEFKRFGLEHFSDHMVLEMLLFYAIPQKDTNELGHRLMNRFGSLSSVFDAPLELLTEVEGITENSAALIKFTAAVIRRYMDDYSSQNNIIRNPEDAKQYMRYKFLCEQKECVYMACMGNNGKVIFCARVAEGSPEMVNIVPAEIVKTALRANAIKAVLAHNHPNGFCNPSSKDLRATSILWEELRRVDVELIDHIIVAQDGVYSMRENNMFPAAYGQ